jgi:hypothetical protein
VYHDSQFGVAERHFAAQLAFGKRLGADDVDLGDVGGFAFDDREIDRHAVAFLRGDGGLHARRVLARA